MDLNNIDVEKLINEDIFELLNLGGMAAEKKKIIMADMVRTVQNRVTAQVLDNLLPDEIAEFEKIAESQDKQKIDTFLKNKGMDLQKIATEEAIRYKTEVIALMQKKTDKPASS